MGVARASQVDAGGYESEAVCQPRREMTEEREGDEGREGGRVSRERVGDQLKLYNHYSTITD